VGTAAGPCVRSSCSLWLRSSASSWVIPPVLWPSRTNVACSDSARGAGTDGRVGDVPGLLVREAAAGVGPGGGAPV